MKRAILLFVSSLWVILLFIPRVSFAFTCSSGGQTYTMAAASMPKKSSDTPLESDTFSTNCSGDTTWGMYDALRIQSAYVDSALTNADYTVEVSLGGGAWQSISSIQYACMWPVGNVNYNCNPSGGSQGNTRSIKIRISRNSDAAITTPIPNNQTIATIVMYQRSNGVWNNTNGWVSITLYYKLNGEITPVVPTCDVKNFDNTVTLPEVKRTDLVSHGSGRYAGATKEFNINLACENTPKVNVTFNGDKMSGVASEDVLVNKLSGNDNVGVQILYGSNPLKIGEKVAVLSAAGSNELLKFNAYYYYKGGTVQGGTIKSQSEFTFTYE